MGMARTKSQGFEKECVDRMIGSWDRGHTETYGFAGGGVEG